MVTVTETAAKKISELRLEEGKPEWGLRVRVVGGGCSGMSYELGWEDQQAPGGTVEAAWSAVAARHPELAAFRPFTLFAVGHEYVKPDHQLAAGDELCLFPPVSGGAPDDVFRVVEEPLSPDAIAAAVDHPGAGGIVIFSGIVRNETGGRPVKFLEYEA